MIKKNVGVLLPMFTLPSRHGIGEFSQYAYQFIDWLKEHHYSYWQILPLNPVGPGNSPYMTVCSEAIDIRFISLDALIKEGLLDKVPDFRSHSKVVDYDKVYRFKDKYLRKAFKNSIHSLNTFEMENPWVIAYSKYLILKKLNNDKRWNEWEITTVPDTMYEEFTYHIWCQFIAYKQWNKILNYAHKKKIQIIADCPFYVGFDSVDCYMHKDEFLLDEKYNPTFVSGCPPDAFSDDGQLWGTPIYDFAKMKQNNFSFLVNRVGFLAKHCDILRLDHFRAFDTYCIIPAGDENARRGVWKIGPRTDFFDELYKQYPNIRIIAEDLGDLFDSVIELRDYYHLPGMRIMEFNIFDDIEDDDNLVVYPGTHDNQTLYGWLKSLNSDQIKYLRKKLHHPRDLYKAIFEHIWNMGSYITIFQLQDLLKLDDKTRINFPGTTGAHNWSFKFKDMSWMNEVKFGQ